ncbi:PREDICTED: golgi-associated plant pathogenesis-related protein 1 [Colobus angolensis palliatus]|uniref:golgi-associated plant pathogenesis-related protein 1 n=1 Tax=Colobus angolensis palliatus TaxID=336983 RepID=UPI0005F38E7D|nr:PREDICTED: golgi-associated plant pathogenesis-related protein 1 [Colobus angolensis palliatus]
MGARRDFRMGLDNPATWMGTPVTLAVSPIWALACTLTRSDQCLLREACLGNSCTSWPSCCIIPWKNRRATSKQFHNEVLKAHNEYRQKHGVPPLKLCKKLNREAQQYSEALASTRILKHSPESSRGQCGENLAWASYDQTGKEVADRWYSEIKNYNFQQPGFTSGTGHFTAMVWKNTKKMGVGKASASDGSSFVVARYFPAGNVVNEGFFEENVLPPKK